MKKHFVSIQHALDTMKLGKMLILVDRPDRENEGDLFIPAQYASPQIINSMLTHARGLICVPTTSARLSALAIPVMVAENQNTEKTRVNFAVSINAQRGVTTGVSAFDRSVTIKKLADPKARPEDFVRPGHIFPLQSADGGLWERDGHTEAAVELLKLAGLEPVGVLCEILRADGKMASIDYLLNLSQKLDAAILAVSDIVRFVKKRKKTKPSRSSSVRLLSESNLDTTHGRFRIRVYYSSIDGKEHIALTRGKVQGKKNVCVRIHSRCLTGDTLMSLRCDCREQLHKAMKIVADERLGTIVYLDQEGRGIGLSEKIKAYALQERGLDTVEANVKLGHADDERDFRIAADILHDLEVLSVSLLTNNPRKVSDLKKYGITVRRRIRLETTPHPLNKQYLETKKKKLGHRLQNV